MVVNQAKSEQANAGTNEIKQEWCAREIVPSDCNENEGRRIRCDSAAWESTAMESFTINGQQKSICSFLFLANSRLDEFGDCDCD